eukprot:2542005-Lingulodinium_polyedra.AAC.1
MRTTLERSGCLCRTRARFTCPRIRARFTTRSYATTPRHAGRNRSGTSRATGPRPSTPRTVAWRCFSPAFWGRKWPLLACRVLALWHG